MKTKYSTYLGSATLSALLLLSLFFYKERTVFVDLAYHLFSILALDSFAIQNYRIASFFTQLFPLLGGKAGLSLNTIALAYSASFVLLPIITFFTINNMLRNSRIAITYLLFVILMTTHTFYWTQSELPQATAFLFIFFALLDNALQMENIPWSHILLGSILLIISSFSHPLLVIPFVFVISFYFISYPNQKLLLITSGLFYLLSYATRSIFFKTPYESNAMGGLNNIFTLFPNYFSIQSNINLLQYFYHDYYFVVLLLIGVTIFYIKTKSYLKLFITLAWFFGYCFIINISFPNGGDQFYLENQYLLLSIIVGFPFVFDLLPTIKTLQIQLAILSIICLVGVSRVYNTHQPYTQRLSWNRDLLKKTDNLIQQKIICTAPFAAPKELLTTWGTSYELWLLSTLETGRSRSVVIEEQPGEFDWALPATHSFIVKWGNFPYAVLKPQYFNFSDTTAYVKLRYTD